MRTAPTEWIPRDPETLDEAIAENNRLRRCLGALAAHGPTILDLAKAASVIGGDRYRGLVCAYEGEIWAARKTMKDIRSERYKRRLRRSAKNKTEHTS